MFVDKLLFKATDGRITEVLERLSGMPCSVLVRLCTDGACHVFGFDALLATHTHIHIHIYAFIINTAQNLSDHFES